MVFKHGTATVVMGNVHRDIASWKQRKSHHAQIHSALFTQRQAVMKDTEVKNPFFHIYIYVKIILSGASYTGWS